MCGNKSRGLAGSGCEATGWAGKRPSEDPSGRLVVLDFCTVKSCHLYNAFHISVAIVEQVVVDRKWSYMVIYGNQFNTGHISA